MFIVDAHLDLAMNAMEWNRDLRLSVEEIRLREKHMVDKPDRSRGTVSLQALRQGQSGLLVATQIARYVDNQNSLPGWHSPEQAWAQTQGQLAWYKAMEQEGEMRMIRNAAELDFHLADWNDGRPVDLKPIGYLLSLEGADSMVNLGYLEKAHDSGLRAIGPAHYGPGRYANGTDATGKMGAQGIALLKEMGRLGMILDATHLCDEAFWQALGLYQGPVWASHNNCRALVDHNRQYSDDQVKALIERDAVIGMALDAWMIVPDWIRSVSTPASMNCSLDKAIDHLDRICQLAGNSLHAGIGSDLDGAFGKEQCPSDLETIADLRSIPSLLQKRGYTDADIRNIMHENWLRFLRKSWKG